MIRRVIQYFICLILANANLYFDEKSVHTEKLEGFEEYLKEDCFQVKDYKKPILIFDYKKIEKYVEENFEYGYVKKNNETDFILNIKVKKGIFLGEINKNFLIKRGDLYVDWD